MIIQPAILKGPTLKLIPLTHEHKDVLYNISEDERIWTFNPLGNGRGEAFDNWFAKAIDGQTEQTALPFVAVQGADNEVIGTTRFYDMSLKHKRLQIGYTWFHPAVWGTGVNDESKFIMLQYAFETMGVNRVAFSIDNRNQHSCKAIQRIGATYEGILRSHMVLADGYVRDTVTYSIVKEEWPAVKKHLSEDV